MGKKPSRAEGTLPSALPLGLLLLLAPFALGLFFESFCAPASLVLLLWLAAAARLGCLRLRLSPPLIASAATVLFFALGAFWGVDRGAALLGTVKFLPVPLFAAACTLLEEEQRARLRAVLPWSAAAMTLLSATLGLIPALRPFFWYGGIRLTGFFQYPNSFALFALLGILLLGERDRWGAKEIACLIVLLGGIVLSRSRAVAALAAAALLLLCLLPRGRSVRLLLGGLLLAGLAAFLLLRRFGGAAGETAPVGLLARLNGDASLSGRFLYALDALPVILRHPLGLGYLGYWFSLGGFQTGAYSVMHVHNGLLQLLLDVGWLPAALFVWAVWRGFRRGDALRRLCLGVLTLHCLFDFDMQFVCLFLCLILLLDHEPVRELRLKRGPVLLLLGALGALSLYGGAAAALYEAGDPASAARLYPAYTQAELRLLTGTDSAEEMETLAERILSRNESVSLVWSAKARAAFSRGDFGRVMEYKRRALALSRYDLAEYLDYADMLRIGEQLYAGAGDARSAERCRQELEQIPAMLDEILAGTHPLAWKLEPPPELTLPEDYAWLRELT